MQDIIEVQRAVIKEHIRDENAHNWPEVYDTFVQHDHAFFDFVPFQARFSGLNGVKDFYRGVDSAFPDFRIDVWAEYYAPGCSTREITVSGTHRGEWCGLPATGRTVRFHMAVFFIFGKGEDARKLLAERLYFDNETIMRQIRGEQDFTSVAEFASAAKVVQSSV